MKIMRRGYFAPPALTLRYAQGAGCAGLLSTVPSALHRGVDYPEEPIQQHDQAEPQPKILCAVEEREINAVSEFTP
jgi:hypothetical protein